MSDPVSKTTEPQPGHIWISGSRYVPQREVIDIVPGGWSTLVKYRRGNEGGSRTCSMEAWNAWARRNVATVKETTKKTAGEALFELKIPLSDFPTRRPWADKDAKDRALFEREAQDILATALQIVNGMKE